MNYSYPRQAQGNSIVPQDTAPCPPSLLYHYSFEKIEIAFGRSNRKIYFYIGPARLQSTYQHALEVLGDFACLFRSCPNNRDLEGRNVALIIKVFEFTATEPFARFPSEFLRRGRNFTASDLLCPVKRISEQRKNFRCTTNEIKILWCKYCRGFFSSFMFLCLCYP